MKIGAQLSNAANAGYNFDFGDYTGLDFFGNVFYPAWADNSKTADSKFDIYTAAVTVTTSIPSPAGPGAFQPETLAGPAHAFSLDPRLNPKFLVPAQSRIAESIVVLAGSRMASQGILPSFPTAGNAAPAQLRMFGAPVGDLETISRLMAPAHLPENDLLVARLRDRNFHLVIDALFERDLNYDGAPICALGTYPLDNV